MYQVLWLAIPLISAFPLDEVCEDSTWKCVTWKKYCSDPSNKIYMEMHCRQTCDLCPKCEDVSWRCSMRKAYCNDASNSDWMYKNCRKTCGICTPVTTTIAPPATPTPTWKVVPAGKCGVSQVQSGRIINGINAKKGAWPWQVLIRFMKEPHCGGTIINPFWIITAGHCAADKTMLINDFEVITGEHDFNKEEGSETRIGLSKIIVHPKYVGRTLDYDITLMKLNRPLPFNKYVATACLPSKNSKLSDGTKCYVTGWGKMHPYDKMHPILQQAMLPTVNNNKCYELNTNHTKIPVTDRMICAGLGPQTATGGCHGDSGGPFVCQAKNGRWFLEGSVSWGSSTCDTKEAYTVFASISYFRDWIDKEVAKN